MADSRLVFPTSHMRTHMPFFDGETLLFCGSESPVDREFRNHGSLLARMRRHPALREQFKAVAPTSRVSYREWKLYYCPWGSQQPIRLNTGLGPGAIECSPCAYQDGGKIYVSFIGGTLTARSAVYHLYTMAGNSFGTLSPATKYRADPTDVGAVGRLYASFRGAGGITIITRGSGERTSLDCSLKRIFRVSFRADDQQSLLITGLDADNAPKTLVYHIGSRTTQEIRSSVPVYKSSVFGDRLLVSVVGGEGVEPYQLLALPYSMESSQESVRVHADS